MKGVVLHVGYNVERNKIKTFISTRVTFYRYVCFAESFVMIVVRNISAFLSDFLQQLCPQMNGKLGTRRLNFDRFF